MKADEVMEILTDGNMLQWWEIAERVERLNAMLLESQTSNAQLVAELDNTRAAHQSERDDWRAEFDRVTKELRDVADAGIAARNRLYFLEEHLPAILADWLAPFEAFADVGLVPEFVERRKQVRQLLGNLGAEGI